MLVLCAKPYILAPLSLTAMANFRAWVREQVMAEVRSRLDLYGDLLAGVERRAVVDAALASIDTGAAESRLLDTVEGQRMIAWLSLQPHHPGLTLEAAGDLVEGMGGKLDLFQLKVETLNGVRPMQNGEPPSEPAPPPAPVPAPPVPMTRPPADLPPAERRRLVFEAMCKVAGVTPRGLVGLPTGVTEAIYLQQTGAKRVDRLKLKAYLYEYAQEFEAKPPATTPGATDDAPPPDIAALVDQLNSHTGKPLDELAAAEAQ